MARTLAVVAALAALLAAGCSGKSNNGTDAGVDAGETISAVELCDRVAAAKCTVLESCFPAFERDTAENCRAREQNSCLQEYDALRTSFEAGAVEVDLDALTRCEQRMSGVTCPPTFPPNYPAAAHAFSDCELTTGLLRGKLLAGSTSECRNSVECEPGSICANYSGCFGPCSAHPKEGEPCAFGCAAGLYCDDKGTQDLSDDRCAQPKGVGESCADSSQCADNLYCLDTCREKGKPGESCVFDPLRTSTCQAGLACDVMPFVQGATGTCVVPRSITQSCAFHWSCAPGLVCGGIDWTNFPNASPGPGTCVPPESAGQPCSFTPFATYVGDTCAAGNACGPDGVCHALGSLGDSCNPTSLSCTGVGVFCKPLPGGATGTCSGPAQTGESCGVQIDAQRTVFIACATGYCDKTTLTCRAPNKPPGELCTTDGECSLGRCAVQQDSTQRCAEVCN